MAATAFAEALRSLPEVPAAEDVAALRCTFGMLHTTMHCAAAINVARIRASVADLAASAGICHRCRQGQPHGMLWQRTHRLSRQLPSRAAPLLQAARTGLTSSELPASPGTFAAHTVERERAVLARAAMLAADLAGDAADAADVPLWLSPPTEFSSDDVAVRILAGIGDLRRVAGAQGSDRFVVALPEPLATTAPQLAMWWFSPVPAGATASTVERLVNARGLDPTVALKAAVAL